LRTLQGAFALAEIVKKLGAFDENVGAIRFDLQYLLEANPCFLTSPKL